MLFGGKFKVHAYSSRFHVVRESIQWKGNPSNFRTSTSARGTGEVGRRGRNCRQEQITSVMNSDTNLHLRFKMLVGPTKRWRGQVQFVLPSGTLGSAAEWAAEREADGGCGRGPGLSPRHVPAVRERGRGGVSQEEDGESGKGSASLEPGAQRAAWSLPPAPSSRRRLVLSGRLSAGLVPELGSTSVRPCQVTVDRPAHALCWKGLRWPRELQSRYLRLSVEGGPPGLRSTLVSESFPGDLLGCLRAQWHFIRHAPMGKLPGP